MPVWARDCPVCGEGVEATTPFATVRSWDYMKCPTCAVVFLNPTPTREELDLFYNGAYRYERQAYQRSVETQPLWLDWLEKYRPGTSRLLEVGCSYGYFLA